MSLDVKKITNFALSLANKLDLRVQEFSFNYTINYFAYLKKQIGGAITKSFLDTILTTVFYCNILSKRSLIRFSTKWRW